jgi:hypothetical protein
MKPHSAHSRTLANMGERQSRAYGNSAAMNPSRATANNNVI